MPARGKNQLFTKTASRPDFVRVNYYLPQDQVEFLEELCFRVRREAGYKLNMSEVIRTLIQGAREKQIDYSHVESIDDLKDAIFG